MLCKMDTETVSNSGIDYICTPDPKPFVPYAEMRTPSENFAIA
jgi:hypothetical protein